MTKESIIELQKIDCNCNDCKHMIRDLVKFKSYDHLFTNEKGKNMNMKWIIVIAFVVSMVVFAFVVCLVKKHGDSQFDEGAMSQIYYIQTFPNDGFMSYGFRQYLKNHDKPNSAVDMKVAFAKYNGVTDANVKDTLGLQHKIDSASNVRYQEWLKEVEVWKRKVDSEFLSNP